MKLEIIFLICLIKRCIGARLSPMENNDKLQDITNLYVAEWQWESWPIKQDPAEQKDRPPSQRKNVALWKDSSKSAWYLFGGQPVNNDSEKVYSDVWKFTVKTRVWKRLFPSQAEVRGAFINKTGGTGSVRANLFDVGNAFYFEPKYQNIVLCGGLGKTNPTKVKKINAWSSFSRKTPEKNEEKLTSLAVYAPKTSRSNTVWQIDVKDKLWTAYVCCCDTAKNKNENSTKVAESKYDKIDKNLDSAKNDCTVSNQKINKAEDDVENEQQHLKIGNPKYKNKKINQMKKINDKLYYKKIKNESKSIGVVSEVELHTPADNLSISEDKSNETVNTSPKKDGIVPPKNATEKKIQIEKVTQPKMSSKYCPEFSENGTSVTWCDGRNEALITSDINSPQIVLWVFSLRTSHWSQLQVNVTDDIEWPGCSDMNTVRYAGNEEEVYIICSQPEKPHDESNKSANDSSNATKTPSKNNFNEKLVYRINYKERVLQSLGKMRLNSYFNTPEGEKVWQNDSLSVLQVIRDSENETILILAYQDLVDLWILNKDQGKEKFDLVKKIWRGSALKWFDKYNAALYSLQFVSESGNSDTILLSNPRNIGPNDYWPRERGRFIIRVFKNENLKNQSFENRTREQNLTYELLQSDYKPSTENQLNHIYSLKVIVFFGISLAIFTAFGFVVFLKRCVNCPPRIRVRNECHKSPLVIRYSVIPDDLLYPVA